MLPCARSVLRRRGLALLRGFAEGECGRGEALANARCAATLAGLGGRGRVGRWADPPARGEPRRLGAGWPAGAQTRSFLGCGDGEEGSVLSKVYEERRVMGYVYQEWSACSGCSPGDLTSEMEMIDSGGCVLLGTRRSRCMPSSRLWTSTRILCPGASGPGLLGGITMVRLTPSSKLDSSSLLKAMSLMWRWRSPSISR